MARLAVLTLSLLAGCGAATTGGDTQTNWLQCDASRTCASGQRCMGGACVPGSANDADGSSDVSAPSEAAVQGGFAGTGGAAGTGGTSPTGGAAGSGGSVDAGPGSDGAAGTERWARSVVTSTTATLLYSSAADRSGNVYVGGTQWGPIAVAFGNGVTTKGTRDRFSALLIKYNSSGTAQWAVANGADTFAALTLDPSGNVYAAGYLAPEAGTADFGNAVTLPKADTLVDAVLVKYDSSGTAQWAQRATGGSGNSDFVSVASDRSGNLYVAGHVEGTAAYDLGNSVTVKGSAEPGDAAPWTSVGRNVLLAKYDSAGKPQWARSVVAGSLASTFASVAVDSAGNVYAVGSVGGIVTYDFGNGVTAAGTTSGTHLVGEPGSEAVLVKYDSTGTALWARTVATGGNGSAFDAVAVDPAGNVYAGGAIGGPVVCDFGNGVTAQGTLGPGIHPAFGAGSNFAALVKYDSAGVAQWARTVANGAPQSTFRALAVDTSGNVYAAGDLYGAATFDFGNGATATTSTDGINYPLLVKYDSSGAAQWAGTSRAGGAIFNSVSAGSKNDVHAAGGVGDTGIDFGDNVSVVANPLDGGPGWNALLVRYQ
jgi:hypothetical protein